MPATNPETAALFGLDIGLDDEDRAALARDVDELNGIEPGSSTVLSVTIEADESSAEDFLPF